MANCYQEQQPPLQEFQESGEIHRFAMLQLNSTPPPCHHHELSSAIQLQSPEMCTRCGSLKRRSPSSLFSLQEPSAKRAAVGHPASADAAIASDENQNNPLGSGKLPLDNAAVSPTPLPPISSDTRQRILNRSYSDITSYMGNQETQPREILKINSVSSSPSPAVATLPPLPPVLYRSLSEPIPSDNQLVAASTPSRAPSAARAFVPSPCSDQENSNSKRLRRIKERMKQMSQWVEKVASEDDENEDKPSKNDNTSYENPKEMSEKVPETRPTDDPEAVRVEERVGNIIVYIKCPCGRGYEVILSGKKCYYRLT